MDKIKLMINSISTSNLLKIFDIQVAIAVLIGMIIFRTFFSKIIIKIYYLITKNNKSPKEAPLYRSFNVFFIILGLFLSIRIGTKSFIQNSYDVRQAIYIVNKIFKIIVFYYITKLITEAIREDSIIIQKLFTDPTNKTVNMFICKIIRAICWTILIFIIISEFGYDLSGLLTALGLGSAALALAAQDLVKSLLSGALILTDKPFTIGDWVEVGEYQGTVIDISFRSVRIKALNNAVVNIPNSTITSTYVVNWNRLTSRRFECILGLNLNTTPDEIKRAVNSMRLVLQEHPKVIKETVQVSLDAISNSSVNIKIYLYVNEQAYVRYIKIKQELLCSLLEVIEKEHIELAYPTQTLYLRKEDEN